MHRLLLLLRLLLSLIGAEHVLGIARIAAEGAIVLLYSARGAIAGHRTGTEGVRHAALLILAELRIVLPSTIAIQIHARVEATK